MSKSRLRALVFAVLLILLTVSSAALMMAITPSELGAVAAVAGTFAAAMVLVPNEWRRQITGGAVAVTAGVLLGFVTTEGEPDELGSTRGSDRSHERPRLDGTTTTQSTTTSAPPRTPATQAPPPSTATSPPTTTPPTQPPTTPATPAPDGCELFQAGGTQPGIQVTPNPLPAAPEPALLDVCGRRFRANDNQYAIRIDCARDEVSEYRILPNLATDSQGNFDVSIPITSRDLVHYGCPALEDLWDMNIMVVHSVGTREAVARVQVTH